MKKSISKLLAIVMVLALVLAMMAGCGSTTATEDTAAADTAAATEDAAASDDAAATEDAAAADDAAATETAGIPADQLHVALINTATPESSTWTSGHYDGYLYLCEAFPDMDIKWVDSVDDSGADCGAVIDELVEEGYNLIFTTSYGFMAPTQEKAAEYPDVLFYHNQSTETNGTNQGVYDIRDYEAVFLTGYLTQLVSGGDEMAYIGSNPMPTVVRACNSFALGAKYANENVHFNTTFVNSWYDVTLEKEAATAMIQNGATGIGMQVGSTAVVQACEEAGVPCAAFSQDLEEYGPNSVVTSFLWNWGPEYVYMVQGVIDGTLTGGEDIFLGLSDGCGAVADYNMNIVTEEQAQMADDLMAKLLSGEVVVFTGDMVDNEGNVHGEGQTVMSDEEIRSMMWLVDFMDGTVG